jgi:anti-sigma factor ChrR (cupin superfamily)
MKFEDISWVEFSKGILSKDILINLKGFNIKFFKLEPNSKIPFHKHSVKEYDFVLEGSMSDERGNYKKRDLVENEKESSHAIHAGPEGCEFIVLWNEN